MSEQDVKAGLSGEPFRPGMSLADYERGVAMRLGPKVEVPGVAYTLILVAPILLIVYPVLGLTLAAVAAGVVALSMALPMPQIAEVLAGIVICVMAFFPGYFLERRASQLRLYRIARSIWRLASPVLVMMLDFTDGNLRFAGLGVFDGSSGAELFGGLVILALIPLICWFLDRLYFPVTADVLRQREQLAKGIAPTRGLAKRGLYGCLWLLPIVVACSVAGNTVIKHAAPERIEPLRPIVYLTGVAVWFLLCACGVLPGTSKRKKLLIDPDLVDVGSPGARGDS